MWFTFALVSTAMWALVNVCDSMLINRYESDPRVITFLFSIVRLFLLLPLIYVVDLHTSWMPVFVVIGILDYIGFLLYVYIMGKIDASVANSAWALHAIILSLVGFSFFNESWTMLQTAGSVLTIAGVCFVSFWHAHVSLKRTLGLLFLLALTFIPDSIVTKMALNDGESYVVILFWLFMATSVPAILYGFCARTARVKITALLSKVHWHLYILFIGIVILSLAAGAIEILSLLYGQLSLVSIVANAQPFFVMLFAGIALALVPARAPRELLTTQSIQVKMGSFAMVFAGLAMLAV